MDSSRGIYYKQLQEQNFQAVAKPAFLLMQPGDLAVMLFHTRKFVKSFSDFSADIALQNTLYHYRRKRVDDSEDLIFPLATLRKSSPLSFR